jgi:hypothetical protein
MTSKLPLPLELSDTVVRSSFMVRSGPTGGRDPRNGGLDTSRRTPGLWTGSREGIVATMIAFGGALLFGGAAGVWFAPGDSGWPGQALVMAGGSIAMAFLVSLCGSLLAGRNAIFWGTGMPLLVYVTGTVFALLSGHAGAGLFIFGAPVFMGLAIAAGVMTAYVVDRGD